MGGLAGGRTDVGWITSTTIQQVTALAIVGMQIKSAEKIAEKQHKIAKGYLKIAQELHDMWKSNYVCIEVKAAAEACGEAYHTPQYEEQAGRYAMSVKKQFQQSYEQLEQCLSPYCTGMRQLLSRDIAIEEARAVADAVNYAYRYAEHRAEALNDRRWSHMTEMIGLGRGLVKMSLSYSQAAGQIYSSLGNQAAASVAGAGKLLGYAFNRSYDNAKPAKYNNQAGHGYQQGTNPNQQMNNIGAVTHQQQQQQQVNSGNQPQFNDGGSALNFQVGSNVQSAQNAQRVSGLGATYGMGDFGGLSGAGVSGDK